MNRITIFNWLSVILVVTVMITLVGCGQKEAEKATPIPTAVPTATATTQPPGEAGILSSVTGNVTIQRQGSVAWAAAASGTKIWTGDGLKTGSDGYVLITFFDGSVMEVEAYSEISVEELSKTSGGSTTVHINQVIGNTINRVESLVDSSSNYEVETAAGSAVVRGTVYNVTVEQYGYVAHTCISTANQSDDKQHSVVFSNSGKTVNISESMSACCWEGGVPSDPFYSDPADDPLQNVTGDGGGGGEVRICDWNGTWCTDYGQMEIYQIGYQVQGIYVYDDGECYYSGIIVGNVSGDMLTGIWVESSEGCGEYFGEFEFTISGDCNSFTGRWCYCEPPDEEGDEPVCEGEWEEEGWSGTRGSCPSPCSTYTYNGSETYYPDCSLQYIEDSFSTGDFRWYLLNISDTRFPYIFSFCEEVSGSCSSDYPVVELYSYTGCVFLEGQARSCYGSGDPYYRFLCPEPGYYLLKVYEDSGISMQYTLAYYEACP